MENPNSVEIPVVANGEDGTSESSLSKAKKPKPSKALPTQRIQFAKQLEMLRAYAVASGNANRPVSNREVAGLVKMHENTATLANSFFIDTGLLQRGEGGFIPCDDVRAFARAREWDSTTASHKLAPTIAPTWFAQALMPRVSFDVVEEKDAIAILADAASAGPDYRGQLKVLLDYMEAAGLIERDGTKIRACRGSQPTHVESKEKPHTPTRSEQPTGSSVATTFAQSSQNVVQFNITVKVDMSEFAKWTPDRIAAFFSGIAQVLAAKSGMEKTTVSDS